MPAQTTQMIQTCSAVTHKLTPLKMWKVY